jgi:YfiH family protein
MADGTELNGIARKDAGGMPAPLVSPNLRDQGVLHGFFLSAGGVSEGIYSSLNCGRGSKDVRDHVEENRRRVASALGVPSHLLLGPRQIHSPRALVVTEGWNTTDAPEADAVVTSTRGIAISVLTADCAPVLIADTQAGVIAAVHAGWKGAKAGVLESALDAMESLGAQASRATAAIGPAISAAAYEVGPEFKAAFLAGGEDCEKYFSQPRTDGRPHFDLTAYVKDRLLRRGVINIQDVAVCTYANESILFSHRRSVHRADPDYGRQISAIVIA